MAHAKKVHRHTRENPQFSSLSPLMQDLLCIVLLYVVTLFLFRGIVFDNAAFASEGDTANWLSYSHAGERIAQTEGEDVLWIPYFFSGMPTFGNVAFIPHNVSYVQTAIQAILNLLYLNGMWTWLVVYDFLGGLFMFFLIRVWKFSRPAALIASLTFMLSPYAVGLAGEGHGSELMALSYLPLVVLLTHLVFEKRDVLSFGLLGAAVGTLMLTNHMQIVYYEFILLGFYLIFHLVTEAKLEARAAVTKVLLFAGALALGFCISSYIYFSVYEYAQFSMRGGGTTGAAGGLAYDYATNWSWHPGELITLLIPGFYGMKEEYYWGLMTPWTNSSVYVGIVPVLFTAIALVFRRTRYALFFGIMTLLIILLSFGRNLSLLYEFCFRALPFFNKFRSPSMILHLLPFTTGVLAALGFVAVTEARERDSGINCEKLSRVVLALGGMIAALLVILLIAKGSLFDALSSSMFLKGGEAEQFRRQYGAQASRAIAQIQQLRFDIFWKDYAKFSVIATTLCSLVWAWLKGKMSESMFSAAVIVIVIIDLSIVCDKYIDPKPIQNLEQNFRPDATIVFLKQQPGMFRVFPLGQLFMDNTYAYHGLQSVGGYSPAKLKIYQTMLDSCMYSGGEFPLNMGVVDMLNVEFLVAQGKLPEPKFQLVNVDQSRRILTYRNPGSLPRVFFADTAVVARTDADVFKLLNAPDFHPKRTAILYRSLPQLIAPVDSSHAPRITWYKSREIQISTNAPTAGLLILSEIYYPAGWKAFVDGTETEIYRTNYILRSVLVPAGVHEVVFRFDPPTYRAGWMLTNTAWAIAALCVAFGLWRLPSVRRRLERGRGVQTE